MPRYLSIQDKTVAHNMDAEYCIQVSLIIIQPSRHTHTRAYPISVPQPLFFHHPSPKADSNNRAASSLPTITCGRKRRSPSISIRDTCRQQELSIPSTALSGAHVLGVTPAHGISRIALVLGVFLRGLTLAIAFPGLVTVASRDTLVFGGAVVEPIARGKW